MLYDSHFSDRQAGGQRAPASLAKAGARRSHTGAQIRKPAEQVGWREVRGIGSQSGTEAGAHRGW